MTPLVLYHGDCVDGFTAAWAARRFLMLDGTEPECKAVRYGEAPPDVNGRTVYIVDFSYPRDTLLHMHTCAESLVVLDHHKTAEADLRGLDFCVFDMERSGAGITWDWFAAREERLLRQPAPPRPELIHYVEDRDLWRFKLPRSKEVNAYLRSCEQTFESWDGIADTASWTLADWGMGALAHIEAYVRAATNHAYIAELFMPDEYTGPMTARRTVVLPMVNVTYESCSEVANALLEQSSFAVAGYWFERGDGMLQYGFRSEPGFDCSEIAKAFGGGGHAQASGLVIDHRIHERLGHWK